MSSFFKRALPKETSPYLFVTILVLYFCDYDILVNTLFKAVKDGFTVKVQLKNTDLYSSAERS